MIAAKEIIEVSLFSVVCKFNNGEIRKLDVEKNFADKIEDAYVHNILTKAVFGSVKIGEIGQLYWENAAQMRDLDGKLVLCEYDMSPEFVYHNSTRIL